jgi:hypothetical protein
MLQTSPEAQAMPQAPQFARSVCGSEQIAPHAVCDAGQRVPSIAPSMPASPVGGEPLQPAIATSAIKPIHQRCVQDIARFLSPPCALRFQWHGVPSE